jgi:hypothetical protein
MPLWGNTQFFNRAFTTRADGAIEGKPIHGFPHNFVAANSDPVTGRPLAVLPGRAELNRANNLFGVTNSGMPTANLRTSGAPQHAGWVTVQQGRGWINNLGTLLVSGNNIANGNIGVITGGNGTGANIVVTSVNGNGAIGNILTIALVSQGANYNANGQFINVRFGNSATIGSNGFANVVTGGRAGRTMFETLVAMGSLTGTDPTSNNYVAGNGNL